jgi:ribosome-binding factor A
MRAIPHLTFHPDRSMAHAAHIQTVLEEIRAREDRPAEPGKPEPPA